MKKRKTGNLRKKIGGIVCIIIMCLISYERGYAMDKEMEYLREMLGEEKSIAIQYEMNIVLDELFIKGWNYMPSAMDEIEAMEELGEEIDEPLGEYTPERLKEYTDEDIRVEFEYCYGYSGSRDDFSHLMQIVRIYVDGELYEAGYYGWMSYGAIYGLRYYYPDAEKVRERREASGNY